VLRARTVDESAVTIVSNVKVKVNARHSILYLCLHDLLGKSLPLPLPLSLRSPLTLLRTTQ